MTYKNHRLYNEFQQLRYDDKDFAYMWKDNEDDFLSGFWLMKLIVIGRQYE